MDMLRNFVLSEFNKDIGEELKKRGLITKYSRGADNFEWYSGNVSYSGLIFDNGIIKIWAFSNFPRADGVFELRKCQKDGSFDIHDPEAMDKILLWAEEVSKILSWDPRSSANHGRVRK